MAKMFPEWISDEQREANPKFRAEFKVYDTLSDTLSDEWYVFYSRTWTWVEQSSRVRTREADFIIAHPNLGILLLEVKGGGIKVKDGEWTSIDRYGNTWVIQNPYEQVSIAVSSLERRLNDEHPNPFRNYRFSTAVCFPDIDISTSPSFLESKHLSVTIDSSGIANMQQAIVEVMRDNKGEHDPPGKPRILMLKELVAASWYINAPKSIQITDTENEIKKLTENQFKLLYQLAPTAQRLLVTGCAGSGKTMLAAEIARRMVLFNKRRVLLTCYNRNLATWIRASSFFVDNGLMMVTNYQKLCADFARRSGIELPLPSGHTRSETDHIYKEVYPNLLLEAAAELGEQFDAIIVDEAQDFLEPWWTSLLLLLKENGHLHIYYDPQQRIWGPPRDLPHEVKKGAVLVDLVENVRNTKSIHNLTMKFHPSAGIGYKALLNAGIEPEFISIPDGEKEHQVVRRVIDHLVKIEKVETHDIAILTPLSLVEGNSFWQPGKTLLGKYRLVHHLSPKSYEIFCSSIGAAKGLEFPVLILTEVHSPAIEDEISDYFAQLYTGISRARSHIIIISERDKFEHLQK